MGDGEPEIMTTHSDRTTAYRRLTSRGPSGSL
jgi:hypothetical protein